MKYNTKSLYNRITMWEFSIGLVVLLSAEIIHGQLYVEPEQVHIAYGENPDEMVISWVTRDKIEPSTVEWGIMELDTNTTGPPAALFIDGGPAKRSMYMHSVTLKGLKSRQRYVYHCGSQRGWSDLYTFVAMDTSPSYGPKFAVYGDMGNKNAIAMAYLQEEAQRGGIDAILHNGDFAYDMDTNNSEVGDAFMNQIQPIAAYIPYMVCPGNHEGKYNFSNYKARFNMPKAGGDGHNLWYSFDIGPAHIVSISTEVYYYTQYGTFLIEQQYQWLENDLKKANTHRDARPWLILMGHKPMYCSTDDKSQGIEGHCNNVDHNKIRVGIPELGAKGLEDLFYKYGVDLQFYAHEHNYERLWPIYNKTICKGKAAPYTDPPAPVHIVTGSAGNQEGQSTWDPVFQPWSAAHTRDFGYTLMDIQNSTHMHLQQISVNNGRKVVDDITYIRQKHGAKVFNCR